MSATARVPEPVQLGGQQGFGAHGWLACQTPVHWLAVVMTQMEEPVWQQAPRRGTQLLGVQGTPLPSQTRPWAWHWAWVTI